MANEKCQMRNGKWFLLLLPSASCPCCCRLPLLRLPFARNRVANPYLKRAAVVAVVIVVNGLEQTSVHVCDERQLTTNGERLTDLAIRHANEANQSARTDRRYRSPTDN